MKSLVPGLRKLEPVMEYDMFRVVRDYSVYYKVFGDSPNLLWGFSQFEGVLE